MEKEKIRIRFLRKEDAPVLLAGVLSQGWHETEDKFLNRLRDHESGKCTAFVAEYEGEPAGWVNVYFEKAGGPYRGKGYGWIEDFAVLEKYQRRGIGKALMDEAEALIAERTDIACLAVGLHPGYGSAQRLYVKRGYLPDGTGAWYGKAPAQEYAVYPLDDELVIYMSKKLR